MLIKGFDLVPDYKEEEFFYSGAYTIGMPTNSQHCLPFEVFPQIGLEHIDFKKITLFTGSGCSTRDLLIKIIASKLIKPTFPSGMHQRCLKLYVDMCYCHYETVKPNCVYISEQEQRDYAQKKYARLDKNKHWSMLEYFDKYIPTDSFIIIEEPERYMSLSELYEFAVYLRLSVKDSRNQFLISTNSPILLGIRNALIYDFDSRPIIGCMWSYSSLMQDYNEKWDELVEHHKKHNK